MNPTTSEDPTGLADPLPMPAAARPLSPHTAFVAWVESSYDGAIARAMRGDRDAARIVLADAARWRHAADVEQQRAVEALRRAGGSWAEVGSALGVSRQAAHVRYRRTSSG